ncbi:class II holin [Vibrio phage JSF24]|uniref:Holin n=5 Tax=Chatterjeevirus ICP3 TaxID=2733612 RepID=A0A2D0Z2N9_9CAUD|nr:putative lysis protein [Vibrio phage ICP3_2009_B]ADX87582.1 putative lysis protein [Vibrio phage ICP3_2009_A]ASV43231.1 class II holin [Vibrio phage JSF20]ASV43279.1 class II holin [Vibrio phage JSF24]ASV43327.1 class II holin [Vibrio phage JSF34]
MSLEVQFGDTVIRSVPVVGAAGVDAVTRIFGLTLSDWFYVAAIGYTVVQAWAVLYKTLKRKEDK